MEASNITSTQSADKSVSGSHSSSNKENQHKISSSSSPQGVIPSSSIKERTKNTATVYDTNQRIKLMPYVKKNNVMTLNGRYDNSSCTKKVLSTLTKTAAVPQVMTEYSEVPSKASPSTCSDGSKRSNILPTKSNPKNWKADDKTTWNGSNKDKKVDLADTDQKKRYTVEQLQKFRCCSNNNESSVSLMANETGKVPNSYEGLVLMPRSIETMQKPSGETSGLVKKMVDGQSELDSSKRVSQESENYICNLKSEFNLRPRHQFGTNNPQSQQYQNNYSRKLGRPDHEFESNNQKFKNAYQRSLYEDSYQKNYENDNSSYLEKGEITANDLWDDPLHNFDQKENANDIFTLGDIRDAEKLLQKKQLDGLDIHGGDTNLTDSKLLNPASNSSQKTVEKDKNDDGSPYCNTFEDQPFSERPKTQKETLENNLDNLSTKLSSVNDQLGSNQTNIFFDDDCEENDIDPSQESTFLKRIFKQPIPENPKANRLYQPASYKQDSQLKTASTFENFSADQQKTFGAKLLALAAQHGLDLSETQPALPLVDPAILQVAEAKNPYYPHQDGSHSMFMHTPNNIPKALSYPISNNHTRKSFPNRFNLNLQMASQQQQQQQQMPTQQPNMPGQFPYNNQNFAIATLLQAFQNLERNKVPGQQQCNSDLSDRAAAQKCYMKYAYDQAFSSSAASSQQQQQHQQQHQQQQHQQQHQQQQQQQQQQQHQQQQCLLNALQKQLAASTPELTAEHAPDLMCSKLDYLMKYPNEMAAHYAYNKQAAAAAAAANVPFGSANNNVMSSAAWVNNQQQNAIRYQNIQRLLYRLTNPNANPNQNAGNQVNNFFTPEQLYQLKLQQQQQQQLHQQLHQHQLHQQHNKSQNINFCDFKYPPQTPAAAASTAYQQQQQQNNLQMLLQQLNHRGAAKAKMPQKLINPEILLQFANLPPSQQQATAQHLLMYYQKFASAASNVHPNAAYPNVVHPNVVQQQQQPPPMNHACTSRKFPTTDAPQQSYAPCHNKQQSTSPQNNFYVSDLYTKNFPLPKAWKLHQQQQQQQQQSFHHNHSHNQPHKQQVVNLNSKLEYFKYAAGANVRKVPNNKSSYMSYNDAARSSCVFDANAGVFLPGMQYTGAGATAVGPAAAVAAKALSSITEPPPKSSNEALYNNNSNSNSNSNNKNSNNSNKSNECCEQHQQHQQHNELINVSQKTSENLKTTTSEFTESTKLFKNSNEEIIELKQDIL